MEGSSQAYNLLEKDGYIIKKQGIGIFLKNKESLFYNNPTDELVDNFKYGQNKNNKIINFVSGTPSEEIYPFNNFKDIITKILERDGAKIMSYHATQGFEPLRNQLKKELENINVHVSSSNIQITAGSQQALDLMLKTILTKRNNKIIVGDPTYHGALNTFKSICNIFTVHMEEDGFNMEDLERILSTEKILFIYTMMNFSCPTGVCWSEEKKIKLIELSKKYSTYIIEDDFASELYYENINQNSLKSLDTNNEIVIYIKSYSKILMPGLRIAFIVLPNELVDKVITTKFTSDIANGGLEQRFLNDFLKENHLKKHIAKLKIIYKNRYEFLIKELNFIKELKPVYEIKGGFYIWIELSSKFSPIDFYLKCKEDNLLLLQGNVFYLNNAQTPYFRLSFATTDESEIKEGIKRIKKILKNL